ncbi:MAG: hypothetical protein MZV63_52430 [Marinilabiliales bacterium]|nr:hypothetical protein [Marinilabiliales bacterium]
MLSSLTSTVITLYNTDGSAGCCTGCRHRVRLLQVGEGGLQRPGDHRVRVSRTANWLRIYDEKYIGMA